MTVVIYFSGNVKALGETFPASSMRAGISEAERRGFSRPKLDALLNHDRPFASYFLCRLGSADELERRYGEVGLGRLLGAMRRSTRRGA